VGDCLFCKIASGEIPSEKVYEDDTVCAFSDIDPKAPVHVLIIPKTHAASILDMAGKGDELPAMFDSARKIARDMGLAEKGFRLVITTGDDGGQTVRHLHLHLLGGRRMGWPPG
jgi:histidine triad (HIT) family protein